MNQPSYEKHQNSSAANQQDASGYFQQNFSVEGQLDRHLIRFINYDGSVIQSRTYITGEAVTPPVVPPTIQNSGALYQFAGWSPVFSPVAQASVDYYVSYSRLSGTESKKKPIMLILLGALAALVVLLLVILLVMLKPNNSSRPSSDKTSSSSKYDDSDWDDGDDSSSHKNDNVSDGEDEPAPTAAPAAPPTEPPCQHNWADATVYAPKTCTRCGEVSGAALPSPASVDKERERIGVIWGNIMDLVDTSEYFQETYGNTVYYFDDYGYLALYREQSQNNFFYYDDYGDLVFSRKDVSSGVHHYFDSDGNLMLVVNAKGNSGLGDMSSKYRRYYFFENGEMIFALCEGTPNHRLYFYKGRLMRWTSNDIAEDYTYSDEFLMWEQLVTDELAYLGFQ